MKRLSFFIIALGVGSLFLWGCENYRDNKSNMEQVKNRVEEVQKSLERIEQTISEIDTRVATLEFSKDPYGYAVFDPSHKGYGRVDTDCGFFLISLKEIKPYLDGCKVILEIGNPSTVTYSGFILKAKWGKRFEKGEKFIDWVNSLKEKEEKFTQELSPGRWNKIELIVSPAKPEHLGYLQMSMRTDRIKLFVP
jgi:hypothetical protein